MSHFLRPVRLAAALSSILLVAPSVAASILTDPFPGPQPPASVRAAAQDMPLRYAGEGISIVVSSFDEAAMTAAGTLTLAGEDGLSFTVELTVRPDGTQEGKGKVQTGKVGRRLKTNELADGSIEITYRAKRYIVSLQRTGDAPAVLPADPRSAAAAGAGTLRLARHTFTDPKVNGIASHSMLVPKGWTVTGGPFWLPPVYFQVMPSQEIEVKSPEGVTVRIEPSFIARDMVPPRGFESYRPKEGQSDEGFPVLYLPDGLDGWKRLLLEKVLPETHPGATNVRIKDAMVFPDLTQQLHGSLAQQKAMVERNNALNQQMGMSEFVDGWVLGFDIRYTAGGTDFEEVRVLAVTAQGLDSQMTGRSVTWTQLRSLAFSAPAGRLEAEMPLLLTILGSLQETRPWMENRAKLLASIMKISHEVAMDNIAAAARRSEIMSSAYNEVNEASMAGHRSRSASSDRTQERVLNSISETEYYTTPGSSTRVQLPSGYDHVYSNGNDEYLLTNNSLFDPAVELSEGTWTPMNTSPPR